MRKRIVLILISLIGIGSSVTTYAGSHKRPNIIFILTDDLGYGDVSCLNPDSKIQTPHIDRMAASGMSFSDAHSGSSVCTPSRYSILTGRYAWRTSLKKGVLTGYSPALINKNRQTLASMLKKQGYQTACIGKWHLGMTWPTKDGKAPEKYGDNVDFAKTIKDGPTTRGFDYYYGISASMDMSPYCIIENDRLVEQPNYIFKKGEKSPFGRPGHTVKEHGPEYYLPAFTHKAVQKIEEFSKTNEPFFLYFALNAPHTPIAPNKKYADKSKAGAYGDFVVEVDDVLGRIQQALKANGIEENTLLVFTSDNGPETLAYARAKAYNHYSAGELKGVKRDLWEGGHRIPFMVTWPKIIEAGKVSDSPICLVDFFATASDIVNYKNRPGEGEDSYSFLPQLKGKKFKQRPYIIHHSARGNFAIRKGDWVFIDHKSGDDNGGRGKTYYENRGYRLVDSEGELFNLKNDLREFKNLYGKHPEIVTELKTLLEHAKQE